jgi:hypothetical protein
MIKSEIFKQSLNTLLPEVFGVTDAPHGYILDNGQAGLLGTLDQVDSATASARLRPSNETIASHTNHVLFLVSLHNRFEAGEQPHDIDWAGSWTNQVVDAATWDRLRADLRAAYNTVVGRLEQRSEWPDDGVGAYIMLVAHCAYHLGEIKQILTSLAK